MSSSTFVWFGADGPVSLRAQLPDRAGAWSHVMSRVDGTDVWYLAPFSGAIFDCPIGS